MFPKDSLILPSPPKFYPPHPLVCCQFSKVAWIRFRENVQRVAGSELFSAIRWVPEKVGPFQRLKMLESCSWLASSSRPLLWPILHDLLAVRGVKTACRKAGDW